MLNRISIKYIMTNIEKISKFIETRIAELDEQLKNAPFTIENLDLCLMRTTFANILSSYFQQDKQLARCYYLQAQFYQKLQCYDHSINFARLGKKQLEKSSLSKQQSELLLEKLQLLISKSVIFKQKYQEAFQMLQKIIIKSELQQYYSQLCHTNIKLKKLDESLQAQKKLGQIISGKYTQSSIPYGLYLIKVGKNRSEFELYEKAIQNSVNGMKILIELKYKQVEQIYEIYMNIALFQRKNNDLDHQYSNLICAQAMARQIQNNQKNLILIAHKIAKNLQERHQYPKALSQYLKVQTLQKKYFGQSSVHLAKTLKSISDLMNLLHKKAEAKKYQQEYNRLVGNSSQKKGNKSPNKQNKQNLTEHKNSRRKQK